MSNELQERDAVVAPEQIAANLRAWIAALRSGKYSQCTGYLHAKGSGGYCCLGVALEIRGVDWTDNSGWASGLSPSDNLLERAGIVSMTYLSQENSERFGLSGTEGGHLASMNDAGKSFAEIADYIEREILPRYEKHQPTA